MKNKANLLTLISLACVCGAVAGCNPTTSPTSVVPPTSTVPTSTSSSTTTPEPPAKVSDGVTSISLDRNAASLYFNSKDGTKETVQLNATILPRRAKQPTLTWASSNPSVCTVSSTGLITAVSEGSADIDVTSPDGVVHTKCHVYVNDTNGIRKTVAKARGNAIAAKQAEAGFDMPDKILVKEKYVQKVLKDDVPQNIADYEQQIFVSKENAYLRITSNDMVTKVEGGTPEISSIDYIFYTTSSFQTFLFKVGSHVKNYMVVDQSDFIAGGDRFAAVCEVLDSFFTSGMGIATNLYNEIICKDALSNDERTGTNYIDSSTLYGRSQNDAGQLSFQLTEAGAWTFDSDDEEDYGFPANTKGTISYDIRFLIEDYLCTNENIKQTQTAKFNDSNWKIDTYVDKTYYVGDEVELFYPNVKDYSKVDDIFSL